MSKAPLQEHERIVRYFPVTHSSENAPLLRHRYGLTRTQTQAVPETSLFQHEEIECDTPERHAELRFLEEAGVF